MLLFALDCQNNMYVDTRYKDNYCLGHINYKASLNCFYALPHYKRIKKDN